MKSQLKERAMKTMKLYCVLSVVAVAFTGSAWADQATTNQNVAKRAVAEPAHEQANQAWEGASLQTDMQPAAQQVAEQKQQFRKQLNLQYASKRAYVAPDAAE